MVLLTTGSATSSAQALSYGSTGSVQFVVPRVIFAVANLADVAEAPQATL